MGIKMSKVIVMCPCCGTKQPCEQPISPNSRIRCSACGEAFSPSNNICEHRARIMSGGGKIASFPSSISADEVNRIYVAFKRTGFGSNPIWGHLVLTRKALSFELDTGRAALFIAHLMDFGNTEQGIAQAATWSVRLSEISDVEIGTGILNATLRIVIKDGSCQEFLVANRWKSIGPMRKFRENILRFKGMS